MLVSEFVTKYQGSKQKNSLIEKQIKTKYISFETKIALSSKIINMSMYKEIMGKKVFVPDTPNRYQLFVQAVIQSYTTLEWDAIEGNEQMSDISKDFNLLEENGLVEVLFAAIGDDIQKFTTVLNMKVDDEIDLNRSIVPFLETKLEAMNMAFDSISQIMEKPEIQEKIMELIGNQ